MIPGSLKTLAHVAIVLTMGLIALAVIVATMTMGFLMATFVPERWPELATLPMEMLVVWGAFLGLAYKDEDQARRIRVVNSGLSFGCGIAAGLFATIGPWEAFLAIVLYGATIALAAAAKGWLKARMIAGSG